MKKWEYMIDGPSAVEHYDMEKWFNDLGAEGWELVLRYKKESSHQYAQYLFKREKSE